MTCLGDCVECETDQAIAALRASVSLESPEPYTGKGPALRGRQIGAVTRPVACSSHVDGLRSRHSFGCALVTRSGACDCTPNLRTTSREITYNVSAMLGEGWYDDDV